ncbi:MAG: hypothetical protein ACTSWZ_00725 [Candidatus Heimdallarchaeaceae archaeon]
MAIVLSKEELLKQLSGTQTATLSTTPATTDTFSKIIQFMNNPVVIELLRRIMDRFFPSVNSANNLNPQGLPSQKNPIDTEAIFNMIVLTLETISAQKPDMTVKELKEELIKRKEEILKVLNNAFGNIPTTK